MSRQKDKNAEDRGTAKRNLLVKVMEYGLADAVESEGLELQGIALRYDAFSCLMTIKAVAGRKNRVAFVGSDSMINCYLKAYSESRREGLTWCADRFKPDQS